MEAPDNRRLSHNTAEKRRRDKINESLEELRQIVPSSDDDARKSVNKAAILKRSVDYLRDLELMYQRLLQEHHALCQENENLKQLRASVQGLMAASSDNPTLAPELRFPVNATIPDQTGKPTAPFPGFQPPVHLPFVNIPFQSLPVRCVNVFID